MQEAYGAGPSRACRLLQLSRSLYAYRSRRPGQDFSDALGIVGKDAFARARLALDDLPGLRRVLEPLMVSTLLLRMFRIAHEARAGGGVILRPPNAADFSFSPGRVDRRLKNVAHRNHGAAVAARKKLVQFCEFIDRRPPVAFPRLCDEPQLVARRACLFNNCRVDRKSVHALGTIG